jgi:hypothetical protein
MGLLDDAIRDHLELKRLHGADLGEVARQECEALSSVERSGGARSGGADSEREDDGEESENEGGHDAADTDGDTAELDMRLVFDEEPKTPIRATRSASQKPARGTSSSADDPDSQSLDWEDS